MTDPFAIESTRQRVVYFGLVGVYLVLHLLDEMAYADAAGDLVLATLAVPASVLIARRAWHGGDRGALLAGASLLLAGLLAAYIGLAPLVDVPAPEALSMIAAVALILTIGIYLARSM